MANNTNKQNANDAKNYCDKGINLINTDQYEEAIQMFNLAIQINPNNADYYNNKAICLSDLDQQEEALLLYNKAIQINPNNSDYYSNKAKCHNKLGQYEEALSMYNKAIQINPNKADYYSSKANCLYYLRQYKEAVQMHNKAIQINPNNPDYYSNKGMCLKSLDENEEALLMCNKAIQLDPNNSNYYNNKSICLINLGRYEEALSMCDKAIQINPKMAVYYNNKGICLNNLGLYEEAISIYNKAIQIKPNNPDYYYNKGNSLFKIDQYEEAMQMHNKAIQINPNKAEYYYNKGNCLYKLDLCEEAISMYNKAIQINPNNANYYCSKGNCLRNLGQNEEALSMYNKGIQLNPLNLLTQANKAIVLNKIGKSQEVRECIQMCSKLLKEGHTKDLSSGNIMFIKQTIDALEKIEVENGNIMKKVNQIEGNQNEKQNLYNVAKKFTDLVTKISEQQVAINLAQNIENNQDQNKRLLEILDQQNLINQKLKDQNQTLHQKLEYIEYALKKVEDQGLQNKENINQHEKKIQVLNENVVEINGILIDAGVKQKAELNRELQELLQTEEESVFNYYKTFYWTILNVIQTYRIISTNLVSGNYKSDATEFLENHGEKIQEGMKVCLDAGKEICKGIISSIPIVGNIFSFIDKTIGVVVSAVQKYQDKKDQIQFQNKVNAINQVISSRFQTDEELSIKLAQLSIRLTKLRKNIINFPNPSNKAQKGSILSWMNNQISKVEASHFNKTELHDLNDEGVKLALQDVVLLISYIALYSDRISRLKKQDIVDILFDIVDKQLDGLSSIQLNDQPENNSKFNNENFNIDTSNQHGQNNRQANDQESQRGSLKNRCQCNIFEENYSLNNFEKNIIHSLKIALIILERC